MEVAILMGLQASGKSTLYRERFFDTHIRINLYKLKTRRREGLLVQACLEAKQPFVVDNTNPTREDRCRYIEPATAKGFSVTGYYFQSDIEACGERNQSRPKKQIVPMAGVLKTYGKLEEPSLDEGFERLYFVEIDDGRFVVVAA